MNSEKVVKLRAWIGDNYIVYHIYMNGSTHKQLTVVRVGDIHVHFGKIGTIGMGLGVLNRGKNGTL